MKKFNFLLLSFLMLASVSFTSCSDDDEGGVGSASQLVGTWEIVSNIGIYKENGVVVEEYDDTEEGLTCTFHADGRVSRDGEVFATWSYKNGKLTFVYPEEWYEGEYYEEEKEVWTVKELTSSKLVAEGYDKYKEDGITCEEYYFMEWRKVSE